MNKKKFVIDIGIQDFRGFFKCVFCHKSMVVCNGTTCEENMRQLNNWLGFSHFHSHQQGDFKRGLYVQTFNWMHVYIIKFGVPCLTYMNHCHMHEFFARWVGRYANLQPIWNNSQHDTLQYSNNKERDLYVVITTDLI